MKSPLVKRSIVLARIGRISERLNSLLKARHISQRDVVDLSATCTDAEDYWSRALISRVNMPSSSTYQSPMSILTAATLPDCRCFARRNVAA